MDVDTPIDTDHEVKAEDDSGDTRMMDDKPTYRSWKKKYRKMRIVFDQKMHEGEELHRHEQKALATARRLAVEKDQLLELLLDINNSPQIPPEKRLDLSLDLPLRDDVPSLEIDRRGPNGIAAKSYRRLLADIPHSAYATAAERFPDLFADLEAGRDSPADPCRGQSHPPSFLTADDLDNYIWDMDKRGAASDLPTLAPMAQSNGRLHHGGKEHAGPMAAFSGSSSRDFALRNPTSVYNWLRKHAPKTFLQDGETHAAGDNSDDHHAPTTRPQGRAAKGEGRAGGARGSGSARTKRVSAAHGRDKSTAAAEGVDYPDDEAGYEVATPSTVGGGGGGGKGKRKRVVDDDPGYRPKGGSSRPTKKKRKSESGDGSERTPPSTGSKKPSKSVGAGDTVMRGAED